MEKGQMDRQADGQTNRRRQEHFSKIKYKMKNEQ
jgi:hypothetical protein